jgi:hypothetical protein
MADVETEADKCRRLAQDVDALTRRILLELAEEYDKAAAENASLRSRRRE